MHLPYRILYVFFVYLLLSKLVVCKICRSITVGSNPSNLEQIRNCMVINGSLEIVLLDQAQDMTDFESYSFPELVHITGFLLVYQVHSFKTLGQLFPNLKAISGEHLLMGFSVVLFELPDIEEVGLYNLIHIGNGKVRFEYCPKLCYIDTIDWKNLGATDVVKYDVSKYCNNCSDICNGADGQCWNQYRCMKKFAHNCHPECAGCIQSMSPDHCEVCKHYNDDGTCVSQCPKNKYKHEFSRRCITEAECTQLNKTSWTYEDSCIQQCPFQYTRDPSVIGQCRYCGDKCVVNCIGTKLVDRASLEDMKVLCTHITGSVILRELKDVTMNILEKYLGQIKEITGSLIIGRTTTITSLNFLKNLKVIGGNDPKNPRYAIFIFENKNLRELWDFNQNFTLRIDKGTIAFHDNPQLCLQDIKQLVNITGLADIDMNILYSNGELSDCNQKNLTIEIEANPTNVTLTWRNYGIDDNDLIGFTLYYTEVKPNETVTSIISKDVCEDNRWNNIYANASTIQLKNLKPYTRYAYYIRTYSHLRNGINSPIYYFNTTSDDPSEILNFEATAETYNTMMLNWTPPLRMNGRLQHYTLTIFIEPDYTPTISKRNYCTQPHVPGLGQIKKKKIVTNETLNDCQCADPKVVIFQKDGLCGYNSTQNTCSSLIYQISDSPRILDNDDFKNELELVSMSSIKGDYYGTNQTHIIPANATSFTVENLKHFSMYIFFLQACNVQERDRPQCSAVEMTSARTLSKPTADDILDINIEIDGRNASVRWIEPIDPNSVIVSYIIEHQRLDLEHPKTISECITKTKYEKNHPYKMTQLLPGKYSLRVRAASLAGLGRFSQAKQFEILSAGAGSVWLNIFLFIMFLLIGTTVAFTIYRWYKKKNMIDNNRLIANVNPDYAGPIYEEDDWEIDRSDIDILNELGEGSFGKVHQGLIKSRGQPCAIKTMNKAANVIDKMEFLKEGSVMKAFNSAHHVVKLLNIVSRGNSPMVIMELMERGDLKSYLRRCREPSQNLTMNEVYRMAAEIADGMAYLAAKKFIHRDLAARNCMVGADRTVKIGDFGMARDVYETDYYRKETMGLLPVRWMAPESLVDGVFTTDSDVWSYGVVLWEMATLAEQPYQGLSNEEVLSFIRNRGTLGRPIECSDLLYEVMSACWKWRPMQRPTFFNIVDKLSDHVGQGFRLVAFCYSKEGQEYHLNAGPRPYNPPAMSTIASDGETVHLHFDVQQEEVGLFTDEENRPNNFLPYLNQRYIRSSPQQISPGSPTSAFSLDSS